MSGFLYHDSMIYELSELAEFQQVWSAVETVLTDIGNASYAVARCDDPVALAKIASGDDENVPADPRYIERFKAAYGISTISSLSYKQQGKICALLTERGRPYSKAFLNALADPAAFDLAYNVKDSKQMYDDYEIVVDSSTMTFDVMVDEQNSAVKTAVYDLYRRLIPIEFHLNVHCPYITYGWLTTQGYTYGDLDGDTYQNIREGIITRT